MTLSIEAYHSEKQEWIGLPQLNPGDRPGSVSQNKPDGTREVYLRRVSYFIMSKIVGYQL